MIMSPDLGLGSLLAALRQAGIRVGVAETARLQHVFSLPQDLPSNRALLLVAKTATPRPVLSGDRATRLKSILRAVLAKDAEERETIDRVVDLWVGWAERELDSRIDPQHPVRVLRPRSNRRSWRAWSLAALLALALATFLRPLPERRSPPPAPPPFTLPETHASEPPTSALPEAQALATRTFRSEVPVLEVIMPQPVWTGWPLLGLGAVAAVSAVGLWLAMRKRRWLPEHAPLPERKGPPRVFLSPSALLEPQLLEPKQQETLVWGIGRFVAEVPSRRVDLPASVRATARAGGLPEIRFQQARHFREVWLWLDDATDDPALPRLANEVELVLCTNGLPVERASFRGVPRLLVMPSGHVFAPGEIAELRDTALVAVLTDGRVLARQYTADDRRGVLDTLLRGLSHWPHLVFVDFSAGDNDLTAILARHNLEVISPARLADFLGTGDHPRREALRCSPGRKPSEDQAWAAAAALAPAPLAEATVFELRRSLGLQVSPWAFRIVQSEALGPPGLLWWPAPVRVQRLGWLSAAEQHVGEVAPRSLLARALDFWESFYEREIRSRQDEEDASPWAGTPAQQHLFMERALLRLWRQPRKATRDLYELYRGPLQQVIRRHLAFLSPAGRGGADQVELPWTWEKRPALERAMLLEMGMGGKLPAGALRPPSRLWLGVGICGGLALGSLVLLSKSDWRFPSEWIPPSVEPSVKERDELRDVRLRVLIPKLTVSRSMEGLIVSINYYPRFGQVVPTVDKIELSTSLGDLDRGIPTSSLESIKLIFDRSSPASDKALGEWVSTTSGSVYITLVDRSTHKISRVSYELRDQFYQVSISNRLWHVRRLAPGGARVRVHWRIEEKPCIVQEGAAEIWRCGSHHDTRQPSLPGVRRSIAILGASPQSLREARQVAITLLDSGSADVVAFYSDWARLDLNRLLGPALVNSESQVLFFPSADIAIDRSKIQGLGYIKARSLWGKVTDWNELAKSFRFNDIQPARRVLVRGFQILDGDADLVVLRGVGAGP